MSIVPVAPYTFPGEGDPCQFWDPASQGYRPWTPNPALGGAFSEIDEELYNSLDESLDPFPTLIPGQYISGYPDTGSIATLTPEKKARKIVFEIGRRFPLQEVGTGKVKYHVKDDGSKVSYCGTIRPDAGGNVAACKTKPYEHEIKGLPNSCKRRGCPECYPHWSSKASQRVTSVLNGSILLRLPGALRQDLQELLQRNMNCEDLRDIPAINELLERSDRYLPRHIVISPDNTTIARLIERTENALVKQWGDIEKDSWRYRNEFHKVFEKKYRRKLDQVCRDLGLTGYVDIGHDIRLKNNKETAKADKQQDIQRYRNVLDRPDWRYNVKFSPHSHLMAFGHLINAEEYNKRKTGWIYINYGTVYSAGGLTKYLLSHAPDTEGVHSVRYCGDLNPTRQAVEGEIKIPIFPKCQECLEEGRPARESEMVIAKLEDVEYKREADRKGDRPTTKIVSWQFTEGGLSSKPYRTTQEYRVYRIKPPDPPFRKKHDEDPLPPWTSPEEREEQLRLRALLRKERERIRKAQLWIPRAAWVNLPEHEKDRFKWRHFYNQEELAAATAAERVLMFVWV